MSPLQEWTLSPCKAQALALSKSGNYPILRAWDKVRATFYEIVKQEAEQQAPDWMKRDTPEGEKLGYKNVSTGAQWMNIKIKEHANYGHQWIALQLMFSTDTRE